MRSANAFTSAVLLLSHSYGKNQHGEKTGRYAHHQYSQMLCSTVQVLQTRCSRTVKDSSDVPKFIYSEGLSLCPSGHLRLRQ